MKKGRVKAVSVFVVCERSGLSVVPSEDAALAANRHDCRAVWTDRETVDRSAVPLTFIVAAAFIVAPGTHQHVIAAADEALAAAIHRECSNRRRLRSVYRPNGLSVERIPVRDLRESNHADRDQVDRTLRSVPAVIS